MEKELDRLTNSVPIGYRSLTSSKAESEIEVPELALIDAIEAVGFGWFQIKLFFIVAVLYLSEAMELILLSIISPILECEWGISSFQQAMLTTIVFMGMAFGCPIWGYFADRYGRKPSLLVSCSCMLLFGLLSAISPSYVWLLIFRGFAGIGLGSNVQAITTFCEYLPIRVRGKGIYILTVFWGVGTTLEVLLGLLLVESLGWKVLVAFTASPLIIFLLIAPKYMDESARFLLVSGQREKSRAVLEKIAIANGTHLPEGNLVDETNEGRGNIKELLHPGIRSTTILLSTLWFITTIIYFGFVLFNTELYTSNQSEEPNSENQTSNSTVCGLTQSDYLSLLFTSFSEIFCIILCVFLIDVIGRKNTMGIQFAIPSVAIICLLASLSNPAMTFFIAVARGMLSASMSTLNTYTPEVYPTHIRAIGVGTCTAAGRVGSMLSPFIAQMASKVSLSIPIIAYSVLSVCAALVSVILPIETKGRDRGE